MITPSLPISALHLFALANVAVALPLFEVLGEQSHFFVAQGSEPEDVIAFALALSFGVPLFAIGLECVVQWISPLARQVLHLGMVAGFCGLYALRVLNAVLEPAAWIALSVAGLLALAAVALYRRSRELQPFVSFLSPAGLAIPVFFIFYSSISHIALNVSLPLPEAFEADRKPPIVLVVFDELPTLSLLDSDARLDRRRFPNFARLGDRAHWFRYASAASDNTPGAITAIVAGTHDRRDNVADYRSQPRTLFTLLRGSYVMNAWESVTHLVPPELHKKKALQSDESFPVRMRLLLSDVQIVYLHLIAPVDWRDGLPELTNAWARLDAAIAPGENREGADSWERSLFRPGRGAEVERFIASIGADRHPTFHYLHTMLPHTPWLHLPSGKTHDVIREATDQRRRNAEDVRIAWEEGPESRMIRQQQKHLLQTAYADALLGKLLDRLEELGIYDQTLLVVTADHGRSFAIGEQKRAPSSRNYAGTMFIPLLIKLPGQSGGVVSDVNAQSVDVLPSIADALRAEVRWKLDGISLFGDAERPQSKRFFSNKVKRKSYAMAPAVEHFRERLARNVRRFDLDAADHDLYRFGPHRDLIGRELSRFEHRASLEVAYERGSAAIAVDPKSSLLPTHIVGWVVGRVVDGVAAGSAESGTEYVAVSVNGVVGAVSELARRNGRARFEVYLPERLMRGGVNVVEVHSVTRLSKRGPGSIE